VLWGFAAAPAFGEDCSMTGGCENIVGYLALKDKNGKQTYLETKELEVGDVITLNAFLNLRSWPELEQGYMNLRHKSKVKILEFYQNQKQLAVVRVISVPPVEVKPHPWEQK
jgi:hypothetical protein